MCLPEGPVVVGGAGLVIFAAGAFVRTLATPVEDVVGGVLLLLKTFPRHCRRREERGDRLERDVCVLASCVVVVCKDTQMDTTLTFHDGAIESLVLGKVVLHTATHVSSPGQPHSTPGLTLWREETWGGEEG